MRSPDSHGGVVAQVERANNRIEYSLESRAKRMDALPHEWKSDLMRIWIPMVAGVKGGVKGSHWGGVKSKKP